MVSSLGRERGFAEGVAAAYEAGVPVSFEGLFSGERRRRVSLPTYPFQRERHWVRVRRRRGGADAHPLLGERRVSASGEITFETELSAGDPAWLGDHRVFDRVVVPGAFYGAQAAAAAALGAWGAGREPTGGSLRIEDVRFERAMVLPAEDAGKGRQVQFLLGRADDAAGRSWEVFSRRSAGEAWVRHAAGRLRPKTPGADGEPAGPAPERLRETLAPVEVSDLYQGLASAGIALGPAFRAVSQLWSGPAEALAELVLPDRRDRTPGGIHPALLDACFQTVAGIGKLAEVGARVAWVPARWERFSWTGGPAPERVLCHARLSEAGGAGADANGASEAPTTWGADLALYGSAGEALGEVRGLTLQQVTRSTLLRAADDTEDLLYEVTWRKVGPGAATDGARADLWLVWPGDGALGGEVVRELESRDERVIVVGEHDGSARQSWREFFAGLPEGERLAGVVHLAGVTGHGVEASASELRQDVERVGKSALALTQGLQDAGAAPRTGVWFVTRGGQAAGEGRTGELAGSVLWGFCRSVAREFGGIPVRLVDLDPAAAGQAERLTNELLSPGRETEVALRGAGRHVPRLVRWRPPPATGVAGGPVRKDRSYLITGGLGGVGLQVAGWLLDEGAGAVVLNGRRRPDPERAEAVARLRGDRGGQVRVEIADLTDADSVERLVSGIGPETGLPVLGGVVHCAGSLADASLPNLDWARFEHVLWPKVLGAWRLHRATESLDLDLFVLFSSVAGLIGNAGQANYAAANAFLDQLALHRRERGLPGQVIQWGPWSGAGMAEAERDRIADRMATAGVRWITPEQGLAVLGRLLQDDAPSSVVASVDWSVLAAASGGRAAELPALVSEFAEGGPGDGSGREPGSLVTALRQAPPAERERIVLEFVLEEVRLELRRSEPPPPDAGFFDLGMDSLMAAALGNRLNRGLAGALTVPGTVVFDHPNARRLARHLASELGEAARPQPTATALAVPRGLEDPVAIVGMACRFPGADDLGAFWARLREGHDAVTHGRPGEPLAAGAPDGAKLWGAYLADLDRFDAGFFQIPPEEARLMDPQQRLLLETSWHALEDADIAPSSLRGSRTGVYASLGAGGHEYGALVASSDTPVPRITAVAANASNMAIGRVAYVFGFEGPAVAVDTACSSSLVAVHQAVLGLQRGDTDLAIAGGANITLAAGFHEMYQEAGMLSRTGRCRTFDTSADGFVRGEGCGVVVLRRLSEAEAQGDRILAVIRGSAVNQDGARAGMIVPSGSGQQRVLEEALGRSGFDPADVDYLEAHGVGSQLGDPIEVRATAAVYGPGRAPDRPLLMGSVKTNIGHLEQAAGVAALIKAVLSMRGRFVPPHLHLHQPNPEVEWDRLPVHVAAAGGSWPASGGRPPRAAVSAFSLSGTNAHAVLEGYGADAGDATRVVGAPNEVGVVLPDGVQRRHGGEAARGRRLYPLSARSRAALRAVAERHLRFLESAVPPRTDELADLAWTAGVARSHLRTRAGVVFSGREDLLARLNDIRNSTVGSVTPRARRIAFVFSGEGSAWAGMGRGLYETEPVVRAVLDRCERVFREERGDSAEGTGLLAVMFGDAEGLDAPEWSGPSVYSFAAAVGALWSSIGVRPDVVTGYGAGELAAAYVAGVFSLEDGLRLVARPETAKRSVEPPRPPALRFIRGITGRPLEPPKLPPLADWLPGAREPDRPGASLSSLVDLGADIFVEISPRAHLGPMIPRVLETRLPRRTVVVSSQGGDRSDLAAGPDGGFLDAVAALYEAGVEVAFPGLFAGERRRRVALPLYPFQRQRYWVEPPRPRRRSVRHPLLGERRTSGRGEVSFEAELSRIDPAWLRDHEVFGRPVVPMALFAAQAASAVLFESGGGVPIFVEDLEVRRPLILPEGADGARRAPARTVQVTLGSPAADVSRSRELHVFSCGANDEEWIAHATARTGVLPELPDAGQGADPVRRSWPLRRVESSALYERWRTIGIEYGLSMRSLSEIHVGQREAVAEVSLLARAGDDGVEAHPVLFDGCLQVAAAAAGDVQTPLVLAGWDRLWLAGRLSGKFQCHVVQAGPEPKRHAPVSGPLRAHFLLLDLSGAVLGEIRGVRFRRLERSASDAEP